MRAEGVVVLTPSFNDRPGFGAAAEGLHPQALIPKLAVEGFVAAVLPRLAGVDACGGTAGLADPAQDGRGDKPLSLIHI